MRNLIAQRENPLTTPLSGIGNIGQGTNAVVVLAQVLSTTIGLLTVVAALFFMFILITGAIGIVVVIAAMFIMDIITTLLGIRNILTIGEMIERITQL